MIETNAGLAVLDDILSVEGVDGIFVGPFDLSIALTGSIQPSHPLIDEALAKILAACRARGKIATVMGATGQRAAELIAMGFDLVAVGPDHAHLREGARAALEAARGRANLGGKSGY
jgi:4-hydroxy-2-oxoheptanedioate aldolase